MSWLTWLRSEQPAVPRQDGYSIIEPVGRAEFAALAGRVTALERAVSALSAPLSDQARVYYHRDEYGYGDLSGPAAITGAIVPWVSKGVRFVEQLTSPEFVRATRGEAMLLGVSFTILGAGAAWLLALPWYAPMVIGFAGFAVSTGVLIVHNRTLLHATVNQQGKAGEKRRAELRVQVDGVGEGGNHSNCHAEFLYLKCAVNAAQLTEWARAALDGGGLGVHKWTGQGALFTRAQYETLCSELLTMGYLVDRGGNLGRQLTAKGRALCRALAER